MQEWEERALEQQEAEARGEERGRKEGERIGREEGERIGEDRGRKEGEAIGTARLSRLCSRLLSEQRQKELELVLTDEVYREEMYQKYEM